jgi:hypothetical protein
LTPFHARQLFTHDFLTRGILDTDPWRTCDDAALDGFIAALRRVYGSLAADSTLNEGQTEDELIAAILDLLGWGCSWLSQVNLSESGRDDVLDFLLFPDGRRQGPRAQGTQRRPPHSPRNRPTPRNIVRRADEGPEKPPIPGPGLARWTVQQSRSTMPLEDARK